MPLRLILVRHAKSDWGDPALADHDRPLNKRGQNAAAALGKWLAAMDMQPAEVVTSTARRTLETWQIMAPAFDDGIVLRRVPALYHAGPERMLHTLHDCAASPLLMLAHNPGIATFATLLLAGIPNHPRFSDYPTGATLVAAFDADDWADVEFGTGRALAFTTPADLGVKK